MILALVFHGTNVRAHSPYWHHSNSFPSVPPIGCFPSGQAAFPAYVNPSRPSLLRLLA